MDSKVKKSDLAVLFSEYKNQRTPAGIKSGKFATAKCNCINALSAYIDKTLKEQVDSMVNVAIEKLQEIEKRERGY